eukprot:UN5019
MAGSDRRTIRAGPSAIARLHLLLEAMVLDDHAPVTHSPMTIAALRLAPNPSAGSWTHPSSSLRVLLASSTKSPRRPWWPWWPWRPCPWPPSAWRQPPRPRPRRLGGL